MSDQKFTVLTVTVKFTLPRTTSDQDAQMVCDELKAWTSNPDFKECIDEGLSAHLADLEYVPVLPNDPFDHESLNIEVTV